MGRKSTWFRHSLSSHDDAKLINVIEKYKMAGYGFYFLILEHYGNAFLNDDYESKTQQISLRRVATSASLRIDRCKNMLSFYKDVGLISDLSFTSDSLIVELCIPNYFKYYGSLKKEKHQKCDTFASKRLEENIRDKIRGDESRREERSNELKPLDFPL